MTLNKIAAALRHLADALENDAAPSEVAAPVAAPKKGKAKAAPEPAPQAATLDAPTAPAAEEAPPAPSPAVPTISKDRLNKVVLAVAGVDRDAAKAILAKFGVKSTVTLDPDKYQAVFDEFEEFKAKMDAAETQVSLV